MAQELEGPYIVWDDYGCEGWKPTSYKTLAEALTTPRYVSNWEITKKVTLTMLDDGKVIVG